MKSKDGAQTLRSKRIRATNARLAILAVLEKATAPLSVEDIAKQARIKNMDIVTTYRTLETFKKAGLANHVDFKQGKAYYERADSKDHHHVVCTECGVVQDFTGCDYPDLTKRAIKQAKGFSQITSHSLELFGVCTPCART